MVEMLEAGLCTELQCLCSLFHFGPNLATLPHCVVSGFKNYALAACNCSPCTWKCVSLVDLLNGLICYGQDEMASQHFALGMQLLPALHSLISFHLGCDYARKNYTPRCNLKDQCNIYIFTPQDVK